MPYYLEHFDGTIEHRPEQAIAPIIIVPRLVVSTFQSTSSFIEMQYEQDRYTYRGIYQGFPLYCHENRLSSILNHIDSSLSVSNGETGLGRYWSTSLPITVHSTPDREPVVKAKKFTHWPEWF